jgi:hypothetical protein
MSSKLDKGGSILLRLVGLLQEISNKQLYASNITANLHNRIVFFSLLVVECKSRCWADVLLANDACKVKMSLILIKVTPLCPIKEEEPVANNNTSANARIPQNLW